MPVHRSRGKPRPAPPRHDELPDGVPAPARPAPLRDEQGRLLPSPGTTEQARTAAHAAHQARQLRALMGLWQCPDGHAYSAYARLGREFRDHHMAELAATVGGGIVGPGPASIVSTAALQMAASRFLFDMGASSGDSRMLTDASKLGDSSRQNILSAFELCAKEAAARPQRDDFSWMSSDMADGGTPSKS